MSGAQEQRRQSHIERAEEDLNSVLAPHRAQQSQLRDQLAKSQGQIAELQKQLDDVNAEIGRIMEASLWWQLYQKD